MKDKNIIKDSMSIQDVIDTMHDLGAHHIFLPNGTLAFETICHNHAGCGSHKLYYYDNTKLFKCYTGCPDVFDIFEVIIRAKSRETKSQWSLDSAVKWYQERSGFTFFGGADNQGSDFDILDSYDKRVREYEKPEINEYRTKIIQNLPFLPVKDWLDEGIDVITQQRYEVKFYPTKGVVVFPHYDENSRLVGIRQRTMAQDDIAIYGKYRPATIAGTLYSHPLGFNLFGLEKNKENIRKIRKAIVFEGEKSVLKLDSLLGSEKNISVACCGSNFSLHQFKLLESLGVEEIIIAFDKEFTEIGDEDFKKQVENLTKIHQKFNSYVTISFLFDKTNLISLKESPVDRDLETFIKLYEERFTIEEETE